MIEAVLWDVDGTFALTEDLHYDSMAHVSTRAGARTSPRLRHDLLGLSAVAAHAHLRDHYDLRLNFPDWAAERYRYYRENAATIRPRPGAPALWERAAGRGLRQALVSNSDRLLVDVNIKALGLDRPGLVSVSWNDVRHGKPDPEPYLRAAYLLRVEPHACLAIEDSPSGAQSALAAGMTTVVWPEAPGYTFPPGCRIVDDIGQLDELLDV